MKNWRISAHLPVILLCALVASSLYTVHIKYEYRKTFTANERARAVYKSQYDEGVRLDAIKREYQNILRVQNLAKNKLGMNVPNPEAIERVQLQDLQNIKAIKSAQEE